MDCLISYCYLPIKHWYGKEYGWDFSDYGTDLWTYAGDADDMKEMATYSEQFNNESPGRMGRIWYYLYSGLDACNRAMAYIQNSSLEEDEQLVREGEIRFLRALHLWYIVETWGNAEFTYAGSI